MNSHDGIQAITNFPYPESRKAIAGVRENSFSRPAAQHVSSRWARLSDSLSWLECVILTKYSVELPDVTTQGCTP
jgi:hypothetical protein